LPQDREVGDVIGEDQHEAGVEAVAVGLAEPFVRGDEG
jgi:hypothetical protein